MAASKSEQGFWEDFLNIYRNNPCLWDSKSESYNDKHLRDKAYSVLVKKCQQRHPEANRGFVSKKIHNFRCGYRRELKKVRDSKNHSNGDVYVPTLWYFDLLHFIENPESAGVKQDVEAEESDKVDELASEVDVTDESIEDSLPPDITIPICELRSPEPSVSSTKHRRAWKRLHEELYNREPAAQASSRMSKAAPPAFWCSNTVQQGPVEHLASLEDECDLAGRKLACDLRKMTEQQRIIAEKLINDIVFYGKLDKLTENCTFTLTPEDVMPMTLYYNKQSFPERETYPALCYRRTENS